MNDYHPKSQMMLRSQQHWRKLWIDLCWGKLSPSHLSIAMQTVYHNQISLCKRWSTWWHTSSRYVRFLWNKKPLKFYERCLLAMFQRYNFCFVPLLVLSFDSMTFQKVDSFIKIVTKLRDFTKIWENGQRFQLQLSLKCTFLISPQITKIPAFAQKVIPKFRIFALQLQKCLNLDNY